MLPTPDHVLGFKGYGEDMFSGVRDLVSHQEDLDARRSPDQPRAVLPRPDDIRCVHHHPCDELSEREWLGSR
jgi:hypothetical protein